MKHATDGRGAVGRHHIREFFTEAEYAEAYEQAARELGIGQRVMTHGHWTRGRHAQGNHIHTRAIQIAWLRRADRLAQESKVA